MSAGRPDGSTAKRARRDAVRVLKAAGRALDATVVGTGMVLHPSGSPPAAAPKGSETVSARGGELRVPRPVVDALVRTGALSRDGRRIVRTTAGEAYLRRLLSEPEATHAEQHRERRAGTVEHDGARETVTMNAAESPLGRLAAARERDGTTFLHPELVEAGRRLLSDFERSQLRQRMTSRWEMGASTGSTARGPDGDALTDSAVAARARTRHAIEALGPRLGPALYDLVCHEIGLTDIERRRGWPARSGKMLLREALERLADHYRGGARPPTPRSVQ